MYSDEESRGSPGEDLRSQGNNGMIPLLGYKCLVLPVLTNDSSGCPAFLKNIVYPPRIF